MVAMKNNTAGLHECEGWRDRIIIAYIALLNHVCQKFGSINTRLVMQSVGVVACI